LIDKSRLKVTIFGTDYALKADSSHEYIKETAAYLDKKMQEIAGKHQDQSDTRVAVLAGLNITDELFRSLQQSPEKLEEKLNHLAEILEASIED
jgi:cell division protein ZapA (FtsZ GTPase activity inhibitor)